MISRHYHPWALTQYKPHFRRLSTFGDIVSNKWGSETSFVGTWALTLDSYTSVTWTVE